MHVPNTTIWKYFLILVCLCPLSVDAGEWCCEYPVEVFAGKVDPAKTCFGLGRWKEGDTPTEEMYLDCALDDLIPDIDFATVSRRSKDIYQDFIIGIVNKYKKYPKLRNKISTFIVYKGYQHDKLNRKLLNSIMNDNERSQEWQMLIDVADGKSCSKAKLYYHYCADKYVVGEYIHSISLDDIVECNEIPLKFNGTIGCINAQSDIMDKIIRLILNEQKIKPDYLDLLEKHRVKYIRNAIFAKHGRKFRTTKLASYFSRRSWYKINDEYSIMLLSPQDKANLEIIVKYEEQNL